ncbi:putative RNA-directed DNA polymerase [Rosa chinensis]|uniref:Putative RNA-directed DNA polymerase n=1 Tax=Rosa chinensis TaxID=74649 RepID=A0A2P6SD02_ROSCH|nr:putative RNA-directed DNA polymerase [Rosa chinensis]
MLSSIYNLLPVKLDNSNYLTWSFQMHNMLKSLGLEGYIDGSYSCPPQFLVTDCSVDAGVTRKFQEWEKNDKALMTLITATLSSEALSFVVGSHNSCEVWKNLRVRYGVHSRSAAMQLQTNLYTIQKGDDSIDRYFQRIKNITDQLASIGIHIPDEEIIIIVVNGLPSEYMTIKIVIKAQITTMSMNKLCSLLLDEESAIDQSTKSMQVSHSTAIIKGNDYCHNNNASMPIQVPYTVAMVPITPYLASGITQQHGGLLSQVNTELVNSNGEVQYSKWFSQPNNGFHSDLTNGLPQRGGQRDKFNLGDGRYYYRSSPVFGTYGNVAVSTPYQYYHNYTYRKSNTGFVKSRGFSNRRGNLHNFVIDGGFQRNNNTCDNSRTGEFCGFNNRFTQSVSSSCEVCQICSQLGHFAKNCPQRSAPRQVVAIGFALQCQICFKRGHSAAECFHRHHYVFQPQISAKHQFMATSFSSQPKSVTIAAQPSLSTSMPLIPPG